VFAAIGSEHLYIFLNSIMVRFTYFLKFVNTTSMHSVHKWLSAAIIDVNMTVNLGLLSVWTVNLLVFQTGCSIYKTGFCSVLK